MMLKILFTFTLIRFECYPTRLKLLGKAVKRFHKLIAQDLFIINKNKML